MPSLHKRRLMRFYDTPDFAEFVGGIPKIASQAHWLKPEFGRPIVAIYMHVCRFLRFVTIPVKAG